MNIIIEHAKAIAAWQHRNQMYGEYPYTYHLQQVVNVLSLAGYRETSDPLILVAGWLHDAVEDTGLSIKKVEEEFGPVIAKVVYAVTDEPGKNRKERHEKTYPKIKASEAATAVKLADRIANVLESLRTGNGVMKMYQKEHPGFHAGVYKYGYKDQRIPFLWTLLDKLIA